MKILSVYQQQTKGPDGKLPECDYVGVGVPERDRALFEAAPAMLEALERFVKAEESFLASVKPGVVDDHLTDAYKAAKEVIAKARGL